MQAFSLLVVSQNEYTNGARSKFLKNILLLTIFKGGVTDINGKLITFVADIVMRITRYL